MLSVATEHIGECRYAGCRGAQYLVPQKLYALLEIKWRSVSVQSS